MLPRRNAKRSRMMSASEQYPSPPCIFPYIVWFISLFFKKRALIKVLGTCPLWNWHAYFITADRFWPCLVDRYLAGTQIQVCALLRTRADFFLLFLAKISFKVMALLREELSHLLESPCRHLSYPCRGTRAGTSDTGCIRRSGTCRVTGTGVRTGVSPTLSVDPDVELCQKAIGTWVTRDGFLFGGGWTYR